METIVKKEIITEYFDVVLNKKENIHVVELNLKNRYKIGKEFPLKCIKNNKRISLTGYKYYTYYLGDVLGMEVWNQRKLLHKQGNRLKWYADNIETDDVIKKKLIVDSNICLENEKKLHSNIKNEFWSSEKGNLLKKKYTTYTSQHEKLTLKNKKLWENDEYRLNMIKRKRDSGAYSYEKHSKKIREFYGNPKNKEYITFVMNKPERLHKISEASKQFWRDLRENRRELFFRMTTSAKNKKYELNGYKMNSIEYLVGVVLNEIKLDWVYEKIFNFKISCYFPDFFVESKKLIIECYGDFWHANPKFFTENDHTHKTKLAKDVWLYDDKKKLYFENNGYKYLYFWENDILNNIETIKLKIQEQI